MLNEDSPQAEGLVLWVPLWHQKTQTPRDYSLKRNAAGAPLSTSISYLRDASSGMYGLDAEESTLGEEAVFADAPHLRPAQFTAMCWGVQESLSSGANVYVALGKMPTTLNQGWELAAGVTTTQSLAIAYYDGGLRGWYQVTASLATNVPQHYAWSWVPGTLTAHLNGANIGTQSTLSNAIIYGTNGFHIGGINRAANDYDGRLWDARLYDHKLDDAMVHAAYDPATRWDLYYELGRTSYFIQSPAAGGGGTILPQMQQQGLYAGGM